jgi:hypothetical protein
MDGWMDGWMGGWILVVKSYIFRHMCDIIRLLTYVQRTHCTVLKLVYM